MAIVGSPDNAKIVAAILAVGRAQARAPHFELSRATDIATKIDALLTDERTLESTFAVCVTLLRLIGFSPESIRSRFNV
jgi:hypothetical protein